MSSIWAACASRAVPGPLAGEALRLVESQEQVATNALVRTLAEQALLEELIEASKPALPPTSTGLHYLLATPFRYPPLPWGSRFGSRFEPSLFYASRSTATCLAESAYYRCVFWAGMAKPPPAPLETRHTLFSVPLRAQRALPLHQPPFADFAAVLTDRRDYSQTQALGTALRAAGIDAIEYTSARDPDAGCNVGLFTPAALGATKPTILDEWLCSTHADSVTYYSRTGGGIRHFPLAAFLVDGSLPLPAA